MAASALAEDWPQFLGPARNGVYSGGDLAASWPPAGPAVVWKKEVGQGFSSPVVADGRLILFHRIGDKEVVEALDAATGRAIWSFDYPTRYRDDFGFDEGPRAAPTVAGGRIYTFGAEGALHIILGGQEGIEFRLAGRNSQPTVERVDSSVYDTPPYPKDVSPTRYVGADHFTVEVFNAGTGKYDQHEILGLSSPLKRFSILLPDNWIDVVIPRDSRGLPILEMPFFFADGLNTFFVRGGAPKITLLRWDGWAPSLPMATALPAPAGSLAALPVPRPRGGAEPTPPSPLARFLLNNPVPPAGSRQ